MIPKVRHIWIVSYLLITVVISGCAGLFSPKIEEAPQKDIILAMKIKAKLIKAEKLSAAAIHVETSNGVVILSGFVETESQRQLASAITQQIPNVKRIDNQIQVK